MAKGLSLDLNGNFRLCDEKDREIPVRVARARALLAILATSRDHKRTRSWLRTCLWELSSDEQASASLRQVLSVLRKTLGERAALLETDRTYVSLSALNLVPLRPGEDTLFFEDAPDIGEVFEDWLRMERAAQEESGDAMPALMRDVAGPGARWDAARPCIVIAPPRVLSQGHLPAVLAALVCDRTIDGLRAHGLVDLFDLRDLGSDQLGLFRADAPPSPDAMFQVRAADGAGERHFTLSLVRPRDQRVLWSHSSVLAMPDAETPPTIEWLQDITGIAVEAIQSVLFGGPGAMVGGPLSAGHRLFGAAHQLLGMSRGGQVGARSLLRRELDDPYGAALAHAWYAYSFANSVGEGEDGLDAQFREEAEEHCRQALERDPGNGLVLALTAHVEGFVLRRQERAGELARLARLAAPDLPLVWDLSAMNAIYREDAETGHRYGLTAQRLGRFSPYKPLYDSSVSISATLTGRHALAIRTAEALLQRQRGFLAAMRYLSVSLIAEGRLGDARSLVADIQARDPQFTADTVRRKEYPLPGERTRQIVAESLAKL